LVSSIFGIATVALPASIITTGYMNEIDRSLDDLDIDLSTKSTEALENILSKANVIIYENHSITIGDNNRILFDILSTFEKAEAVLTIRILI